MSPDQYASHIQVSHFLFGHPTYLISIDSNAPLLRQAFPEDAQLINKEISYFLDMCTLFGGGVMPVSCRGRRRSSSNTGEGSSNNARGRSRTSSRCRTTDRGIGRATTVIPQDDDDDDDFVPQRPRPPRPPTDRGIGRATTVIPQDDDDDDDFVPQRPRPPRPPTDRDIGRATTVIPQDDDDDDDFVPQRPRPRRPPSPEDTEEPEYDPTTSPFYYPPEPPRRRQPSFPYRLDWQTYPEGYDRNSWNAFYTDRRRNFPSP